MNADIFVNTIFILFIPDANFLEHYKAVCNCNRDLWNRKILFV